MEPELDSNVQTCFLLLKMRTQISSRARVSLPTGSVSQAHRYGQHSAGIGLCLHYISRVCRQCRVRTGYGDFFSSVRFIWYGEGVGDSMLSAGSVLRSDNKRHYRHKPLHLESSIFKTQLRTIKIRILTHTRQSASRRTCPLCTRESAKSKQSFVLRVHKRKSDIKLQEYVNQKSTKNQFSKITIIRICQPKINKKSNFQKTTVTRNQNNSY